MKFLYVKFIYLLICQIYSRNLFRFEERKELELEVESESKVELKLKVESQLELKSVGIRSRVETGT